MLRLNNHSLTGIHRSIGTVFGRNCPDFCFLGSKLQNVQHQHQIQQQLHQTRFFRDYRKKISLYTKKSLEDTKKSIEDRKERNRRYDIHGTEGDLEGRVTPHFRSNNKGNFNFKRSKSYSEKLKAAAVNAEKRSNATGTSASSTNNASGFTKEDEPFVYDSHSYYPPMINRIWSSSEIKDRLANQPLHKPITYSDKIVHFFVKNILYKGFNYFSGFDYNDPSARSCEFRLILLESIAGCPGMVAAVFRHFTSLRTLRRDRGWIHTLLEESQNERMHLLICLKQFDASLSTRIAVVISQYIVVGGLSLLYIVNPKIVHRFVGYLEETAVKTYSDLIRITKEKGTKLNKAWGDGPAPKLAISYWGLRKDAVWLDVLEQLLADESHHRDVNHRFAEMEQDEANPFLVENIRNIEKAGKRGYRE